MDECCICCRKFERYGQDKIVIIKHSNDDTLNISKKRGHYFHHCCISEWRSRYGNCPLDRDPINKLYTVPNYQLLGLELGAYNYDYSCVLQSVKVNDDLLDQFTDVNDIDRNNKTLPFYACKLGNYNLVTKLLRRGADFNRPCGLNSFTPLMCSVCHYHVKIVMKLLASKEVQEHVNVSDRNGHTAFIYACQTAQLSIIKEFINRGLINKHQCRYAHDLYRSDYNKLGLKGKDIIHTMYNYLKTD